MFRKLKTVCLLVLAALLIGLFVLALHFESLAAEPLTVLSQQEYDAILSNESQTAASASAGTLYSGGVPAVFADERYLISTQARADTAISAVGYQSVRYSAAFAPDDAFSDFKEAVSQGHAFTLVVSNGRRYFTREVVFTTLPVLSLSADAQYAQLIATKEADAECSLLSPDGTFVSSISTFRIRGNLSTALNKKSFRLTLYQNSGTRNPLSLLGMQESSEWILLPLFTDDSRMREKVSLDLWNALASTNPDNDCFTGTMQYLELVINDCYMGLYGLVRPVDEVSFGIDGDTNARYYQFISWFEPETEARYLSDVTTLSQFAELKYPDESASDAACWQPLTAYIDLVYAGLETPSAERMEALFNRSNAVDYTLYTACCAAEDNLFKNMLMIWREDADETYRFFRVPWDLDFTFGNYFSNDAPLYRSFCMDKAETVTLPTDMEVWLSVDQDGMGRLLATRWAELRQDLFSETSLVPRFTEQARVLEESGALLRETDAWPESPVTSDLSDITAFLHARLAFLDGYFDSLADGTDR